MTIWNVLWLRSLIINMFHEIGSVNCQLVSGVCEVGLGRVIYLI